MTMITPDSPFDTADLRTTSHWLATTNTDELDRNHADLVHVVDAVAVAAGSPESLRPAQSDPTPALVRLYNHHAATLHRQARALPSAA